MIYDPTILLLIARIVCCLLPVVWVWYGMPSHTTEERDEQIKKNLQRIVRHKGQLEIDLTVTVM
jgi:hypothetical protein